MSLLLHWVMSVQKILLLGSGRERGRERVNRGLPLANQCHIPCVLENTQYKHQLIKLPAGPVFHVA